MENTDTIKLLQECDAGIKMAIASIDEVLEKRIKNTPRFLNIKSKIIKGNIIHIPKTNLAYIEPHKIIINKDFDI